MTTDTEYFRKRAAVERELALICEDNTAALAHLTMADKYERKAQDAQNVAPDEAHRSAGRERATLNFPYLRN